MAILIPSKNIYEQQNKKVLDNKIDGIEVNGKKATNNTTLQEYFNYPFSNSLYVDTTGDVWGMHLPTWDNELTPAENTEYFFTEYKGITTSIYKAWQMFPFEIAPKNHFAKNITLENLYNNLVFSITHDWVAGDTNGSFQKNDVLSRQITSDYTFSSLNNTIFSVTILTEKPTQSNIYNIIKDLDKQYVGYAYSYIYFEELTNNKIKGYFLFCIGADERDSNKNLKTARYAKTSSVSIKMRIGDIEEEDITIKQGDKVNFSISGNELLQQTNNYNDVIPKLAQNILNAYSKGKETAKIRCSISDYFSEKYERSEHIDSADKRFKVIQEPPNDRYDAPPSYGIFETKYRIINIVSFDGKSISGDKQIVVEQISETKLKIYFNQAGANIDYVDLRLEVQDAILINNSTGKMSFKIYDQVIPMVYGANGKDYPMSFYKDGTPKVFQVLGTKIYYDGAVWQELYLQEA